MAALTKILLRHRAVNWRRVFYVVIALAPETAFLFLAPDFVSKWSYTSLLGITLAFLVYGADYVLWFSRSLYEFNVKRGRGYFDIEKLDQIRLWKKVRNQPVHLWVIVLHEALAIVTMPAWVALEEYLFRLGSNSPWDMIWRGCFLFALSHFLLGSSLWNTILTFVTGIIFGIAYQIGGFQLSFQTHLASNGLVIVSQYWKLISSGRNRGE